MSLKVPTKVQPEPGRLQTERLPSGRRKLIRGLVVKLDDGSKITVPDGFETDFSSIPWFARWVVDWAKVDVAGVVHDFLYWCPTQAKQALATDSRKRFDDVWEELAGAGQYCANRLQCRLGRFGLWMFGWLALRKALRMNQRKCAGRPPAGRFVDGGRDGLGGERGEPVGDVRVRLDAQARPRRGR